MWHWRQEKLCWKFSFDHRNKLHFKIYSNRKLYFWIIEIFHNITVLVYFWSNTCHLGKHQRLLSKTYKNLIDSNINGSVYRCVYLGKSWSLPLGLDCDGLCASLKDLINILLTKFRALIFLVHKRPVRSLPEEIFHLQLRQLLNLKEDGTVIRQQCSSQCNKSQHKLAHST